MEFKAPPATLHTDAFVGWLKSILVQFIAKRVLEELCRSSSAPIRMHLLSIDRIRYRVPTWDKFKKIGEQALGRKGESDPLLPLDVSTFWERIEGAVKNYQGHDGETKATVGVFISLLNEHPREYTTGVHAETILATLPFCQQGQKDSSDLELAKVSCPFFERPLAETNLSHRVCPLTLFPCQSYAAPLVGR